MESEMRPMSNAPAFQPVLQENIIGNRLETQSQTSSERSWQEMLTIQKNQRPLKILSFVGLCYTVYCSLKNKTKKKTVELLFHSYCSFFFFLHQTWSQQQQTICEMNINNSCKQQDQECPSLEMSRAQMETAPATCSGDSGLWGLFHTWFFDSLSQSH